MDKVHKGKAGPEGLNAPCSGSSCPLCRPCYLSAGRSSPLPPSAGTVPSCCSPGFRNHIQQAQPSKDGDTSKESRQKGDYTARQEGWTAQDEPKSVTDFPYLNCDPLPNLALLRPRSRTPVPCSPSSSPRLRLCSAVPPGSHPPRWAEPCPAASASGTTGAS